jgi:hydrogenase nickel incorporation protein HypA/HybF
MHELAICQSLLGEVERVAAANGSGKVVEISISVGPLSGVEAPALARAFSVARCGTVAEDASLQIETAPVVVWCPACAAESTVAANALLCACCGSWRVELRSGDELMLRRVELVEPTSATPAAAV